MEFVQRNIICKEDLTRKKTTLAVMQAWKGEGCVLEHLVCAGRCAGGSPLPSHGGLGLPFPPPVSLGK